MSQKKTVFGAVNSPGFGAPVSEPKPLFGTSPAKFSTPFSTSNSIPKETTPPSSVSPSTYPIPIHPPSYQAPIIPVTYPNGAPPEQFNSISAMDSYSYWSPEELRFKHHRKNQSDSIPSDPKTFTFAHQSTVPGFTSSFGKPSAFSTATPGVTSSSGQSTSTTLPKISTTEFFEKREFEVGSTLAFDPIKLAQWLEKHCHSFTNDSSLKLLVKMATVQPAPTSKEPTDESSPNLNSASTSKEPTNGSSPDLNSSTPETSPSTSTTNIQPEPAKPSVEDPMTRLNRFDKITLSDPITFSTTVWEHALSVLSKDSNYTVEMIQDARLVTEYQIGIKFQELMTSASNTPRFVKGVQTFSKQVGEVLDEVFGKLCKLAEEQESLLKE